MKTFKVKDIKEHPINAELYKVRDNTALINSKKENGITKPPVVNQDGVLIAGHRTVDAAKNAGINEIGCQVVKVNDDTHHQILLIGTIAQCARSLDLGHVESCSSVGWHVQTNVLVKMLVENHFISASAQTLPKLLLSV